MRTSVERSTEEKAQLLYGFRRGIGFVPSSIDVEQSLAMMIEYDDEPEQLEDRDLDVDDTWPSSRRKAGKA